MESGHDDWTNWLTVIWDVAKLVLAALGTLATSCFLWMVGRYGGYIAMLHRHETAIQDAEEELGSCRAFREQASKGPIGETLVGVINELKAEDLRIHRRVSATRREAQEQARAITEMRNDIKWICKEMGKPDDE